MKPEFFARHKWKLLAGALNLIAITFASVQRNGYKPEHAAALETPKPQLKIADNEFVRTSLEEYEKYKHLPYVWGGESPYPYEETIKDPFFKGVSVTKKQPIRSWRKGQPTVPGFDCAGWTWYTGKMADKKPFTDVRASAEGYRRHKSGERVWDGKYSNKMEDKLEPGDLVFMMRGKKAYHVATYIGNSKIMECSGIEEPDYKNIPQEHWDEWRNYASPQSNGKTNCDRGGLQISTLSKYSNEIVSVRRFPD